MTLFTVLLLRRPTDFGLRSYQGGKDIVWGGKVDCQHQWVASLVEHDNLRFRPGANPGTGNDANPAIRVSGKSGSGGQFCVKCQAWKGQLGSEPTIDLYISHLVEIFREVKRVLRPDGQFWLNIGDSAAGSGGSHKPEPANPGLDKSSVRGGVSGIDPSSSSLKSLDTCLIPFRLALALQSNGWYVHSDNIWSKVNCMPRSYNGWHFERHRIKVGNRGRSINRVGPNTGSNNKEPYKQNNPHIERLKVEAWRVETGQQDHDDKGGFLQDAIWQDCPGCPKCSPNDGLVLRKGSWSPTESHEYIFQLLKSIPYFGDREAVKEPIAESTIGRGKVSFGGVKGRAYEPDESDPNFRSGSDHWGKEYDYKESNSDGMRNLRSVWTFPTQGFKGAHFAIFPSRLPEIAIKASTSEYGVCDKCGSQWARVLSRQRSGSSEGYDSKYKDNNIGQSPSGFTRSRTILAERNLSRQRAVELFPGDEEAQRKHIHDVHEHGSAGGVHTIGWKPTCTCDSGISRPIVLDPFGGSGTTSMVAERLSCDSIYIDSSEAYTEMARQRIAEDEEKRIETFIKKARNGNRDCKNTP